LVILCHRLVRCHRLGILCPYLFLLLSKTRQPTPLPSTIDWHVCATWSWTQEKKIIVFT
jgi:hypothetical protein